MGQGQPPAFGVSPALMELKWVACALVCLKQQNPPLDSLVDEKPYDINCIWVHTLSAPCCHSRVDIYCLLLVCSASNKTALFQFGLGYVKWSLFSRFVLSAFGSTILHSTWSADREVEPKGMNKESISDNNNRITIAKFLSIPARIGVA